MPGAARCGEPPPDSRTDERQAQLVSFVVSRVGAGVPLLPSVASQAALYRPSAAAAFRISLILSQLDLSSFFRPMPYGSVLNGLPTTLSLPANCDCAAYPARMMSSVVTASTEPWASASTHLEYESNSCRAAFGCSVWIRLAGVGVRTGDGGVVHLHQQVLARHVVRPGEVDLLLAVVVDGVGGDHQVDRALLDERLAVGRRGGLPLDLVLGQAEILGDDLRDLDVEALVLAAGLQPEAGLVGLDPDDQLAFLLGLAHHAGFRRAAATGVVALAAARGGGAERQRQTGQQRQSLVASHAHSSLSASVPWTGSPWRARCAGWRRTRPAPPAPPAGRRP